MRHLKRAIGVTVGLFVLILIAGALLDSGGDTHGKAASKPARAAADRCEAVSRARADEFAAVLKPETGATLRGLRAVRSQDFAKVWFVAADLEGPGLDGKDQIVVIETNSLEAGHGLISGVGGFAHDFTVLLPGEKTDAHFALTDDGAHEAESCVHAALKA